MKINLIFFLARFGFGGAGNSVFRLATSLNKKKFKISIICLGNCAYEKAFKKRGIMVHKLKANRLIFSFFQLRKLISKLINHKTKNIFISNINYTNIFCSIIFRGGKNIKLIGIERTPLKELEIYFSFIDFLKKFILKFLLKIFYSRFDKIICNSQYISNYLKKKYSYNSISINPPSISNNKILNIKLSNLKNKAINIITVCRLSKEKRIDQILFALNKIKKEKFILNIVGDGPEKDKIKKLVKNLKLTDKVKFYGHNKQVFTILKKCNLYINSSYFEGFPNSVVEACCLEIPVIASQSHGGINEILSNGKFGTIYSNNYSELSKKIQNFINKPKLFLDKAKLAKKNVMKFNLKNNIKNFENLFIKI